MLILKKMFILQNNQIFMKNFIHYLIIITLLFSCKKKTDETPKPINKNLGIWYGVLDNKKSTIELTEKQLILNSTLYFTITDFQDYKVSTGLQTDNKTYETYLNSDHFISKDTLFINFSMSDKKIKLGKFVK